MAVVKANYVKRGNGEKGRAKATIRYIQHRRDRDGERVSRTLFGYDGELTRQQAYRMIDEVKKGTIFYRFIISPAPAREDRLRDLNLSDLTIETMLELENRIGKQIQFVAAIHDDHSPHRHVHTLALVQGTRLTKEDFQALREKATEAALSQRRMRDRIREHRMSLKRSRILPLKRIAQRRLFGRLAPYQSYTCYLCGYHQALPASKQGYRCPACGLHLRRDRSYGLDRRTLGKEVGLELSLSA
jgi:rubrerythrin